MRDFELDLFFKFGGHLDLHGNARRDDTLKQADEKSSAVSNSLDPNVLHTCYRSSRVISNLPIFTPPDDTTNHLMDPKLRDDKPFEAYNSLPLLWIRNLSHARPPKRDALW